VFSLVLTFYQSGGRYLFRPIFVPIDIFADDIIFYGLYKYFKHGPLVDCHAELMNNADSLYVASNSKNPEQVLFTKYAEIKER